MPAGCHHLGLTKLFNLIGSTHYAHKEWINYFKLEQNARQKEKINHYCSGSGNWVLFLHYLLYGQTDPF